MDNNNKNVIKDINDEYDYQKYIFTLDKVEFDDIVLLWFDLAFSTDWLLLIWTPKKFNLIKSKNQKKNQKWNCLIYHMLFSKIEWFLKSFVI